MKKLILFITFYGILIYSIKAQNVITQYTTQDGKLTLHAGDTIEFLNGSMGSQFVHVFYMIGNIQKKRAPFSSGYYSELVIDHFIKRKEGGVLKTDAVMNIVNKPKWAVWAVMDDALNSNEIKLKSQ